MRKKILFANLFLLAFSTIANSQTIQQVGYYNVNGIMALSAIPNFMILSNGSVINVSNPSSPILTGSISFSGFNVSVLTIGNYSYFGAGMTGKLIIADVSNPSFPIQVGSRIFPSITGGIFGLAKNNNVIYLAAGSDGIYSVDVSNNTNPIVLDSITITSGQARDIIIQTSFAYVAHDDGLKIIDVSNPSNLTVVTSIGSGYNSIDLDTTNQLAYLGKSSGGIDVFNISNPASPTPSFSIPNSNGTSWDIKYKDNLVYLATNNAGLFIYKITGNSGIQMANFPNSSNGQSFAVSLQDSLIFLSGLINGVAILQYDSLGTVNTNDKNSIDQITISPNPTADFFDFNLNDININEIDITNIVGQSVYKADYTKTKNRIDVSNLPSGNYIVSFKNKDKILQKKLIKFE